MASPPSSRFEDTAHRYQHLYPPVSFFHLPSDPGALAAGHSSHYSLVWCMLHGAQPPLHLFAASMHAAAIEAGQNAAWTSQPATNKQPNNDTHEGTDQQEERDLPMEAAEEAPASPRAAPPAAVDVAPTIGPHGVEYTHAQLISLHRPSTDASGDALPDVLRALSSDPTSWLASCVSLPALPPVCLAPADAMQAALQDELARDAAMTGVYEYAGEWWLPTYGDIARAKGGNSHQRGGGRGGRGRGRGDRGGAAGGERAFQMPQYTNKKHAAFLPSGASGDGAVVHPATSGPANLGGGRKSKKRPAPTEADSENQQTQSKKLYSETHISKMFIGPSMPPAAAATTSSQADSHAAAPTPQATSAKSDLGVAASAFSSAVVRSPAPLREKTAVYAASSEQATSNAAARSQADEIMRNIQSHQARMDKPEEK